MPVWLLASVAGIALPLLFKKDAPAPQAQQLQGGYPGGPGLLPGMQVQSQLPPQQSYPIPLDPYIDPRAAYAVYETWKQGNAAQLKNFAQQIWNQCPIAAAALFARALTYEEILQAQAAAQAAAQARVQQAPAPVATQPAPAGGVVPATQTARIVPTPSTAPQGLDPLPMAETNGAAHAATPAPVAMPAPDVVAIGQG